MLSCEESTTLGENLPPTDVRFGMRAALLIMGCVALAASVVGVVLRKLPESAQPQLVVILMVVAAALVGCVANVARKRRQLERLAGVPRFVLNPHSYLFPRVPRLAARLGGVAALAYSIPVLIFAGYMIWELPAMRMLPTMVWTSLYALAACSFGISVLWWNRGVRICDEGVLVRHQFIPWSDNRRQYWDGCYRDVMVLEWQRYIRVAVRVPAEERERVEKFVRERIAEAKSAESTSGISEQRLAANA